MTDARFVTSPAPTQVTLLDEPHVRMLRADYGDIVEELVGLFCDGAEVLIADMRSGDRESIRRAAHKLKGGCRQLGAARLGHAASVIERAGAVTEAELAVLERTFAATRAALGVD